MDSIRSELVFLILRLSRALHAANKAHPLPNAAVKFLRDHDLISGPMRGHLTPDDSGEGE